jgi:hypothetical protein
MFNYEKLINISCKSIKIGHFYKYIGTYSNTTSTEQFTQSNYFLIKKLTLIKRSQINLKPIKQETNKK